MSRVRKTLINDVIRKYRRDCRFKTVFAGLLGLYLLAGCSAINSNINQRAVLHQATVELPTANEVLRFTAEHEKLIDDAWWFGEYPRIFKSAYAGATPELKAQFALDYASMLHGENENMVANWNSYVPYTKRANFADKWWRSHDNSGRFSQLDRKMHVVWIHEALLDGSELWWRVFELKNENNLSTAQILAHDEEQKKVFNYMDREGQPRSLSDLVALSH